MERYETCPCLTESNVCVVPTVIPTVVRLLMIRFISEMLKTRVDVVLREKMRRVMGEDTISASSLHGATLHMDYGFIKND